MAESPLPVRSSCSSSATSASELSDEERDRSMVPLLSHKGVASLTCREGDFHCPSMDEVNRQIELFEKQRLEFNEMQLKYSTTADTSDWDRKKFLLSLASRIKKMAITMAESMAFRTDLPELSVSWLGLETDAQQYELCHYANGLSVWKKDFGNNRLVVRSEFLVPLSPKQYCEYASNIDLRREWDTNVSEARRIEQIGDGIDIAYVAINPIATIYPRDYVNIRVIKELKSFGRPHRRHRRHKKHHHYNCIKRKLRHESYERRPRHTDNHRVVQSSREDNCDDGDHVDMADHNGLDSCAPDHSHENGVVASPPAKSRSAHLSRAGCYASCSCSIEHPEMPEQTGKVRADVKIACYLAQSIYLPNRVRKQDESTDDNRSSNDSIDHTVWSRVYMFSEVDPRGWIPGRMSNYVAARVLPTTIDRIVTCMLDHYKFPWRDESVYDPELKVWRECESALQYCFLKYLFAIENDGSDEATKDE